MVAISRVPDAPAAASGYAQRFGALLRRHRRSEAISLRRVVERAADGTTVDDLRAFERGERPLDAATVDRLCTAYGIALPTLLPEHQPVVIDLDRRELRVGELTVALPDTDDPSPHLVRYVGLVNRLRSRPMRNPATLRREDTEALAEAFELDPDEVTELLTDLIGKDTGTRRRVMALRSGTGTLAAVIVLGVGASAVSSEPGNAAKAGPASAASPTEEPADETFDDPAPGHETPHVSDSTEEIGATLVPLDSTPSGRSDVDAADDTGVDAKDSVVVDETNIDAPGGPVTIEREDYDAEQGDTAVKAGQVEQTDEQAKAKEDPVFVDETNIDAPGGPVTIEREDYDAEQQP